MHPKMLQNLVTVLQDLGASWVISSFGCGVCSQSYIYHFKLQSNAMLLFYKHEQWVFLMSVSTVIKLVFHEPSDPHRAEKEAIDIQLQEKNAEIVRKQRELQALRVNNL